MRLRLRVSGILGDTVELSEAVAGDVRVYQNLDKTGRVTLPKVWGVDSLPETLYLEGYSTGELVLRLSYPTGWACGDDVKVSVVKVDKLEWQKKADSDNLDLGTCDNNGGKTIFPGNKDPYEDPGWLRRRVDLVARVEPRVEGATVYFKVWDVDDPFNEHNPFMPDVNLIDDDADGSARPGRCNVALRRSECRIQVDARRYGGPCDWPGCEDACRESLASSSLAFACVGSS